MREIRSSGSEGGVADNGHPYPYLSADNSSVQLLLIYGMGGVNNTGSAQSPTVPHPFYQFP